MILCHDMGDLAESVMTTGAPLANKAVDMNQKPVKMATTDSYKQI